MEWLSGFGDVKAAGKSSGESRCWRSSAALPGPLPAPQRRQPADGAGGEALRCFVREEMRRGDFSLRLRLFFFCCSSSLAAALLLCFRFSSLSARATCASPRTSRRRTASRPGPGARRGAAGRGGARRGAAGRGGTTSAGSATEANSTPEDAEEGDVIGSWPRSSGSAEASESKGGAESTNETRRSQSERLQAPGDGGDHGLAFVTFPFATFLPSAYVRGTAVLGSIDQSFLQSIAKSAKAPTSEMLRVFFRQVLLCAALRSRAFGCLGRAGRPWAWARRPRSRRPARLHRSSAPCVAACSEAKQLHFASDCLEAELPQLKEQLQKASTGASGALGVVERRCFALNPWLRPCWPSSRLARQKPRRRPGWRRRRPRRRRPRPRRRPRRSQARPESRFCRPPACLSSCVSFLSFLARQRRRQRPRFARHGQVAGLHHALLMETQFVELELLRSRRRECGIRRPTAGRDLPWLCRSSASHF